MSNERSSWLAWACCLSLGVHGVVAWNSQKLFGPPPPPRQAELEVILEPEPEPKKKEVEKPEPPEPVSAPRLRPTQVPKKMVIRIPRIRRTRRVVSRPRPVERPVVRPKVVRIAKAPKPEKIQVPVPEEPVPMPDPMEPPVIPNEMPDPMLPDIKPTAPPRVRVTPPPPTRDTTPEEPRRVAKADSPDKVGLPSPAATPTVTPRPGNVSLGGIPDAGSPLAPQQDERPTNVPSGTGLGDGRPRLARANDPKPDAGLVDGDNSPLRRTTRPVDDPGASTPFVGGGNGRPASAVGPRRTGTGIPGGNPLAGAVPADEKPTVSASAAGKSAGAGRLQRLAKATPVDVPGGDPAPTSTRRVVTGDEPAPSSRFSGGGNGRAAVGNPTRRAGLGSGNEGNPLASAAPGDEKPVFTARPGGGGGKMPRFAKAVNIPVPLGDGAPGGGAAGGRSRAGAEDGLPRSISLNGGGGKNNPNVTPRLGGSGATRLLSVKNPLANETSLSERPGEGTGQGRGTGEGRGVRIARARQGFSLGDGGDPGRGTGTGRSRAAQQSGRAGDSLGGGVGGTGSGVRPGSRGGTRIASNSLNPLQGVVGDGDERAGLGAGGGGARGTRVAGLGSRSRSAALGGDDGGSGTGRGSRSGNDAEQPGGGREAIGNGGGGTGSGPAGRRGRGGTLFAGNPLGTGLTQEKRVGLGGEGTGRGPSVGSGIGRGRSRGGDLGADESGGGGLRAAAEVPGNGTGLRGRSGEPEDPSGRSGLGIGAGITPGTGIGGGTGSGRGRLPRGGSIGGGVRGIPFASGGGGDDEGRGRGRGSGDGGGDGIDGRAGRGRGAGDSTPGASPVRIVYLLDASSSIAVKGSMEKAKEALLRALSELDAYDSFNVIDFADKPRVLSSDMLKPTPANIARAREHLDGIKARGNTTDLSAAFEKVFEMEGVTHIFLLSDGEPSGGISDPFKLRKWVKENNAHKAQIFTVALDQGKEFGIPLLRALAQDSDGAFSYVNLKKKKK